MWFFSSKSDSVRSIPCRQAFIETLEDRTLMSAVMPRAVKPILKAGLARPAIVARPAAEQSKTPTTKIATGHHHHADSHAIKQAAVAAKKAAATARKAARKATAAAKKAARRATAAAKKTTPHAAVHATKVKKPSSAKANVVSTLVVTPGQQIQSYITSAAPSVLGQWTGTMTPDGSTTASTFSANFAFQRGVAASGTFTFGEILNNQSAVSTMVFSLHHNVRVLIQAPGIEVGMTGALTSNNATLYGRYSFNSSSGWKTGMFILARQ